MMTFTLNLHNMTALELATLEGLLRRQFKNQAADEVFAEGKANAGDEYQDYQEAADKYFQEND